MHKSQIQHIYITICDEFSPFFGNVSQEIAEHRVVTWCREFGRQAHQYTDSESNHPIITFFYEERDYNPSFIDSLYRLCKENIADIEILFSLTCRNEESISFLKRRVEEFRDILFHHHGLLRKNLSQKITYGFLQNIPEHNSTLEPPSDIKTWIANPSILTSTGCYADFTFPLQNKHPITIPNTFCFIDHSQEGPIQFTPLEKGFWNRESTLLVQGINMKIRSGWRDRFKIQKDISELNHESQITPTLLHKMVQHGIKVPGLTDSIFIKLHTKSTIDQNMRFLLSENGLSKLWSLFDTHYKNRNNFQVHYVSAWQMYTILKESCQLENAMLY